jgi:hypothetical protein
MRLTQFGPLHFLSAGAAFGGSGRACTVSRVGVGSGVAGVDVEVLVAGAEVTMFSVLGPDGGTTDGGTTGGIANCIAGRTGDITDEKGGGIENCVLGRVGELTGDENTDGVPGRLVCGPDGMPPAAGPPNPSIHPRK